jgi:hypothetical protein
MGPGTVHRHCIGPVAIGVTGYPPSDQGCVDPVSAMDIPVARRQLTLSAASRNPIFPAVLSGVLALRAAHR